MSTQLNHPFDLLYYRNRKGTVAVALEETPERLYLPTGKQVQHTPAWAEVDVEALPITQQQLAQVQQQHAPIAARDEARAQQHRALAAARQQQRDLAELQCWATWVSYRGEEFAAGERPQGARLAQQQPQLAQRCVAEAKVQRARDARSAARFNQVLNRLLNNIAALS